MAESFVVTSAIMKCSFGMAPSTFTANPARTITIGGKQKGNIMDYAPIVNISPFGPCQSLANPTVASATSAAMGVLTPMPCIPNTTFPWVPGKPDFLVQGQPALTNNCKLTCLWAGQISIMFDGQTPSPPNINVNMSLPSSPSPCAQKMTPLTPEELSNLSETDRKGYQQRINELQDIGKEELALSSEWLKKAQEFEQNGQVEKANRARENAMALQQAAVSKKEKAMQKTFDDYRKIQPLTEEERNRLSEEQRVELDNKLAAIDDDLNQAEHNYKRQMSANLPYGEPGAGAFNASNSMIASSKYEDAKQKGYEDKKAAYQNAREQIPQNETCDESTIDSFNGESTVITHLQVSEEEKDANVSTGTDFSNHEPLAQPYTEEEQKGMAPDLDISNIVYRDPTPNYQKDLNNAVKNAEAQDEDVEELYNKYVELYDEGYYDAAQATQELAQVRAADNEKRRSDAIKDVNKQYEDKVLITQEEIDRMTPEQRAEYNKQMDDINSDVTHEFYSADAKWQLAHDSEMGSFGRGFFSVKAENQLNDAVEEATEKKKTSIGKFKDNLTND